MAVSMLALIMICGIACAFGLSLRLPQAISAKLTSKWLPSVLVAINFILLTIVQHGYRLKAITDLARTYPANAGGVDRSVWRAAAQLPSL